MAVKGPERWSTGIALPNGLAGPMGAVGGLFSMGLDAVKFVFVRPFQWREFLEQSWFVARVSLMCRRCWWRFRSRCWCRSR